MNKWPVLNKPPVVVALMQLKFNASAVKLSEFLKFDSQIKRSLPNRHDNIQVGIDISGSSIPLGVSKISGTSNARIETYVYFSTDQKVKLEISEGKITYIDERPYQGWDAFKKASVLEISVYQELLKHVEIDRVSIRFINRFALTDFDKPQAYFNTLITGSDDAQLPYPLRQYGFRLLMDIPDTDVFSIVNQQVETVNADSYIYTFDIDVLDRQRLIFNKEALDITMDKLREIKNEIFFNNITSKTLELCN
jgi:uncharacterized protein (TIGR04255 family)